MKRLLILIFACVMVGLNLLTASAVQAQPLEATSLVMQLADVTTDPTKDLITKLKTDVLPQLEKIFTPEQSEQFTTAVESGTPFRKAFKSLTLTPEQKTQLKTLFKTLPKKDAFASLTPEQKKLLFVKKGEMFKPTPEEIADKISTKMKAKEALTPTPAGLSDKISEKIKTGLGKMGQ